MTTEALTNPQLTLVRSTTNMFQPIINFFQDYKIPKAPKQFQNIEKLQATLRLKLEKLIDRELLKLQKRKLKKSITCKT